MVDVVPGTAFMIRTSLFKKLNGFDERFFLYFEENDLCRRVQEQGLQCFITPYAQVIHLWGRSTKHNPDANKFYLQSRFLYFQKYYGVLAAHFVQFFLSLRKSHLILFLILIISIFLLTFKLPKLMSFFGDIGWYYLAARDMILTGKIPLVGISSSHVWLHQGAYWTYLLAGFLKLGDFHPVAGGILAILFGLATILVVYFLGKRLFSSSVGLMAAAFYATSPLAIVHARMPYHTTPIPFFSILYFLCLFKWVQGSIRFFPLSILVLAILYNFEIATLVLAFPLFCFFLFGAFKKKDYVTKLLTFKMIGLSSLAFALPMLPMLLYDLSHGFPQTIKVILWFGYRLLVLFGHPLLHPEIQGASLNEFFSLSLTWLSRLVFAQDAIIAFVLFIGSVISFSMSLYKEYKKKKVKNGSLLLALWLLCGLGGFLVNRVPSEAYLPMIFAPITLLLALFFIVLFQKMRYVALFLFIFVLVSNVLSLLRENYYLDRENGYGASLQKREEVVNKIIKEVGKRKYQLDGKGQGSQFESFTMNYEYLLWWKGHPPVKSAKTIVTIDENPMGITYQVREKED